MGDFLIDKSTVDYEINAIYEYWKSLSGKSKFIDSDVYSIVSNARKNLGWAVDRVVKNEEDVNYREKISKILPKLKDDQLKSLFDMVKEMELRG